MADSKEESLADQMGKSAKRLKAATSHIVQAGEPLHIMQTMKWENNMLRAELTALRDYMLAKGQLDTAELQRRTKDHVDKLTQVISDGIGISVSPDGMFITTTDRYDKGLKGAGIIKPS